MQLAMIERGWMAGHRVERVRRDGDARVVHARGPEGVVRLAARRNASGGHAVKRA